MERNSLDTAIVLFVDFVDARELLNISAIFILRGSFKPIIIMDEKKRKRSSNFSKFEGEVLVDLAMKYKHIIENKRTDGVTIKKKSETWMKIQNEFNSVGGK